MKFIYTTGRIHEDEIIRYGNVLSTKRVEGDFKIEVDLITKNKLLCRVCIGNVTSNKKGIMCFARYGEKDYKSVPFEFVVGKWHGSYFKFKDDFKTDYNEFDNIVNELECPQETKELFLRLIECIKTKEKIGLYNIRYGDEAYDETDDYEDLDEEDMYDEITPKTLEEKKLYYDKHNIFKETLWDKKVTCIHCDKTFMFNDFKVVREKPEYCEDENEYIVCKHYPKCDGSLIDMIPIENNLSR